MNRKIIFTTASLIAATAFSASSFAQTTTTPAPTTPPAATTPAPATGTGTTGATGTTGPTMTTAMPRVDASAVNKGFRTSKVVGASVVNSNNETIGKIDDLIVTPDEKVPFAIVSVGGFLGIGDKLVVVPYSSFSMNNDQVVLAGATKDSLKALPDYTYTR
jgi:sporulation protein YlmC with PRC-barrel domain